MANDSRACYFRNGDFAKGYVQCPGPDGTKTAACCNGAGWPNTDPCFSNGFCFSSNIGVVYRGACTDWGSTDCVQQCQDVVPHTIAMVSFCEDLSLCCTAVDDENGRDCCNGTTGGKFGWDAATFTGSLNASTLYDVYDSRQAIVGAGATNATTNGTGSSDEQNDNTISQGAIIGVGVGLGIPLLIALALCVWLFITLRKARSNERKSSSPPMDPPFQQKQKENFVLPQAPQQSQNPFVGGYASYPQDHPAVAAPAYKYPSDASAQNGIPLGMKEASPKPAELPTERGPVEAHSTPVE